MEVLRVSEGLGIDDVLSKLFGSSQKFSSVFVARDLGHIVLFQT
jgi:hypothetical protein